jgi:hypothetical protein
MRSGRELLNALGLVFGCFDFVVTKEGCRIDPDGRCAHRTASAGRCRGVPITFKNIVDLLGSEGSAPQAGSIVTTRK